MRNMALAALVLAAPQSPSAANVDGNGALALAALVAEYSPLLSAKQKDTMHHLLYGVLTPPPPPEKIVVKADNIVCRASNVDITEHSCALTFGPRAVNLKGRGAHELYATIDEVGVPPDGAAGSVFESLFEPELHDRSERDRAEGRRRCELHVRSWSEKHVRAEREEMT